MALRRRSRSQKVTDKVTDTASTAKEKAIAAKEKQPLTAKRAKRMLGVGVAVAPMLAPYALAIASSARGAWDARRAARLGVDAGELAAYAGPGGTLHARLSRVAEALNELDGKPGDAATFVTDTRPRLAELAVAVRAAEQMPTTRRRTAYRAVGDELDRIEIALLTHLGVVSA